jgi:hypothetical protein
MPINELNTLEINAVAGGADLNIAGLINQVSKQQLQQTQNQVVVKFSSNLRDAGMNMLAFD